MTRQYQLKVTSPSTTIDVNSTNADEVARIVQLAGIIDTSDSTVAATTPYNPPQLDASADMINDLGDSHSSSNVEDFNTSNDNDDDEYFDPEIMEVISKYDYGNIDDDDDTIDFDLTAARWNPEKPKQTFGKNGDNTLTDTNINIKSSKLFDELNEAYNQYLSNDDMENDNGQLSPLSHASRGEFETDPFANDTPVDDGSHSPLSTIIREPALK